MLAQDRPANSVFHRLTEPDGRQKTWAQNDLRKLIDLTMAGRSATVVAHKTRDLANKSLGEESGSLFTQKIAKYPPLKKFSMAKFNAYNGRTNPADHVRYCQQVTAY